MKRIKLKDIAREAGVSISTASRILNDSSSVTAETFARVKQAALRLGIELDIQGRSKVVAFILSNREMLHPFHARILLGAQAHLTAHSCDTLFLALTYSPHVPWNEIQLPKVLRQANYVRSAIVAGAISENLLNALRQKGIYFAALGNNVLSECNKGLYFAAPGNNVPAENNVRNYDVVFSDDIRGAYEITRYLQSLGHRDIWVVGNDRLPWFTRCYKGYAKAMGEAGFSPHVSVFDSDNDQQTGYLSAKSILDRHERITAILANTDAVALGVYKALAEYGIRVPNDMSVAGCNDTYGPLLQPPLTTICEFPEHLGKRMAEMVLQRMNEPNLPPMEITVPTELVKRESCARVLHAPDSLRAGESDERNSESVESRGEPAPLDL